MMDKRPRKELIDGLRDSLRNFEERYDRSEWEHFQQHRNGKRRKPVPLFVKLAGIAVALVVVVYASVRVLPLLDRTDDAGKHTPSEVPHPRPDEGKEQADSLTVDSLVTPTEGQTRESTNVPTAQSENTIIQTRNSMVSDLIPREEVGNTGAHQHRKAIARVETNAPIVCSPANQRPARTGIVKRKIARSPQGGRKPLHIDLPKIGGWSWGWPTFSGINVGAHISPVLTNKGFSLGGGVSARLPLTNRLTAEIGVSYLNVKVGQDKEADPADTVSLQVVGVQNAVGMVAVPVSLNYAISENFGASLGLVPFRVVRDQRTDILQRNRWVGNGDGTGRLEGERSVMKRADSVYMGNTYLGFVRLSGQYTPPILPRRNLVLAPFVAVPVGRLWNDDYRWLHGGVSVRWYLR
ncbi:hypothetical protein [Parapedobacter sp. 10938]|uniref:hypothetical protein n=1 Tax=Parapedobacter flavus TaxID=3110225 RepID=UPI002DB6AF3B|nr:hypothetical protein [Parapedobacter sp. 10938]MEC3881398.1 hypothetical protein [Parapedobacter sp. 10938]